MMLEINDLRVAFQRRNHPPTQVIHGLSLSLERGETLGIVGESGSGKSVMSLAAMGLLPGTATATGSIMFEGRDILTMPERDLCKLRGRSCQIIMDIRFAL